LIVKIRQKSGSRVNRTESSRRDDI